MRSKGSKLATILVGRENKNNSKDKSKEGTAKRTEKRAKKIANSTGKRSKERHDRSRREQLKKM